MKDQKPAKMCYRVIKKKRIKKKTKKMSEVILKLPLITTSIGNLKEQCSTNKMGSKPKTGCHSRGVYEVLC